MKKGNLIISEYFFSILQFQKISTPTTRVVFGNLDGVQGLNSQFFKRKYETKMEIPGAGMGWEVLSLNRPYFSNVNVIF